MIEKFGFHEKPISNEEWLQIGKNMANDHHVRLKTLRMIADAEHQTRRFENLGNLAGGVLFLAFLKFPVIRYQPGFRRVGAAATLAFPFYYYLHDLAERLKVKRIKAAYRKHIVVNGLHPRVTI